MDLDRLLDFVFCNRPGVFADSRLITGGDVFVAVKGTNVDGHDFILQAVDNGAKFIVCEKLTDLGNVEVVVVVDSAKAFSLLAHATAGNPAKKLTSLAVTGTNGKTTIAFMTRFILEMAGKKTGLVSTIVCDTGNGVEESTMTTPDAVSVAEMMGQMAEAGLEYAVMEASSHALKQGRLFGINFAAAAFTNLTGDHMDYHKTTEDYLASKSILFENLSKESFAILNGASSQAGKIAELTDAKVLWYDVGDVGDIIAKVESMDMSGTVFTICYAGESERVSSSLVGDFNVYNCLAAAGLCIAAGVDLKTIARGISEFKTVPGRLERVGDGEKFAVFVDYAHTDDALDNVLKTLKPLAMGRIITVFGCGGDRDVGKRPRMAKIAQRYSEIVIVTSDNPRTEEPGRIICDILAGFEKKQSGEIKIEADRRKAIRTAVESAGDGDIVLIAGKGHEGYQIIGKEKIHFSDVETVCEFL